MSGDPFRAHYREVARQNRNAAIRKAVTAFLFVLGAFVVSILMWAAILWMLVVLA